MNDKNDSIRTLSLLDLRAKVIADERKISYSAAYRAVLEESPELYQQYIDCRESEAMLTQASRRKYVGRLQAYFQSQRRGTQPSTAQLAPLPTRQ